MRVMGERPDEERPALSGWKALLVERLRRLPRRGLRPG